MMKSEVARLMAQIDAETTAACRGLSGLAAGTLKHAVINAKMERIAALKETLTPKIGEEAAVKVVIELLEQQEA
ncbi:MAG TPA: hypothetical protein VJ761_21745 [Ktedonobacteraceae bacterium]|nr:hypothetical protein [Ktedonobacteraceae bacterium]